MQPGYILADIQGLTLTADEQTMLQHPRIAGVVLFRRNYASREQLRSLTQQIRNVRERILICVDQEGGRVQRFREAFTMLPSMRHWGEMYQDDPDLAKQTLQEYTKIMITELYQVGIDINFVPVLDVDQGVSWVIGGRSFFSKPEVVTDLARAMIDTMHDMGMPATGKHFPGHGAVALDSHEGLPQDPREFAAIDNLDLKPFAALANTLDAIMPAHIVYPQCDQEPAGFSKYWLQTILREKLNFQGVIVSDDLSMGGAAEIGTYTERAEKALNAGCDLLIVCNNQAGLHELLCADLPEPHEVHLQRIDKLVTSCKAYSQI